MEISKLKFEQPVFNKDDDTWYMFGKKDVKNGNEYWISKVVKEYAGGDHAKAKRLALEELWITYKEKTTT